MERFKSRSSFGNAMHSFFRYWGVVLELLVQPILTAVPRDLQQSQSALSGLSNPIPSIH
jgi:hypothetical protein